MPPMPKITIYTNDGTTVLGSINLINVTHGSYEVYVNDSGISPTQTAADGYIYDGPGKWLGVSTSPNTTTADYGPGTTFTIPSGSNVYAVIGTSKNTVSIDLSTLSGYSSIISGTHNIAVKAKAAGYMDSDLSASVSYIGPMPAKGDILTIESKQYRILKINGNIAELLSLYDTGTKVQFSTGGNTYAGGTLDTYCNNTFYNSLSSTMKAAIIDKTFTQDSWHADTSGSPVYTGTYINDSGTQDYIVSLDSATYGSSITRHCYVISIQDIIDYLEVTPSMTASDTTLTAANIWMMFWNSTSSVGSSYLWLRSTESAISNFSFMVIGASGRLNYNFVISPFNVHPAFQIDLSKIDYTK